MGALTVRVFVGFSSQGYSLVFWFSWRHRLTAVGQPSPSLSWFFAAAEGTFGYVSKSKFNFGLWILNSNFGHLLIILGVCSVGSLIRIVELTEDLAKCSIGVSRLLEILLVFSFSLIIVRVRLGLCEGLVFALRV